jgi:formylglycine-generating enzyme required for sulfatase activity
MEFVSDLQARFRWNCQLPTEAQWEYACRGLTSTPFHYGPDLSSLEANFDGNFPYGAAPTGPWLHQTSPRGTYRPNLFGLFDMHGNVWEWCADWYDDSYYTRSPVRDPAGPPTGVLRVLRGGSWYSYSWTCRSGGRERFSPDSGSGNYGFRLAMQDD